MQCKAKNVSLLKYLASQNLVLYSRLFSFVNRTSAFLPNEGVSSIGPHSCLNRTMSPKQLSSMRVECLRRYIDVVGSGYGPGRAENKGFGCGTMSKCCTYARNSSVPTCCGQPLFGTILIMS